MNLEDDLRAALRREPAPKGFAADLISRVMPRVVPFWRRPATLAIAAALAIAALVPPVQEYRGRRRAAEARDQLLAALSITRVQLELAKERIRQNSRHKL